MKSFELIDCKNFISNKITSVIITNGNNVLSMKEYQVGEKISNLEPNSKIHKFVCK